MHILYKITYLPHVENNTPPFYYVGSKYNYDGKYMGSPASKQSDWYTGGLSIADWWKQQVRNNPQNFKFEIVADYDDVQPQDLVEHENELQLRLNVKDSDEYFNKAIATCGWVSAPRTEETKNKIRAITSNYWQQDTDEVLARKEKLVEYNKKHSADRIRKTMMEHPDKFEMTEERKQHLSNKVSEMWASGAYDNRKPRKQRCVRHNGTTYDNAAVAANEVGCHPASIRRKCKSNIDGWSYAE